MKNMMTLKTLVVGCTLAALASPAMARPMMANWTFETSIPTTAGPYAAEGGLFAASSFASGFHASTSAVYSNPAGNGSTESYSANGWAVGDYWQFTTSTVGYEDVLISWDQTGSGTGPRDFTLQYSTNGSTFTDVMNYMMTSPAVSWSTTTPVTTTSYSADLSAIAALENAATIYVRFTVATNVSITGATIASGGTNRVDNVIISATEVPAPGALALLGLAGVMAGSRRRR